MAENFWADDGRELVIVFRNGAHCVLSSFEIDEEDGEYYGVVFIGNYEDCVDYVKKEIAKIAEAKF